MAVVVRYHKFTADIDLSDALREFADVPRLALMSELPKALLTVDEPLAAEICEVTVGVTSVSVKVVVPEGTTAKELDDLTFRLLGRVLSVVRAERAAARACHLEPVGQLTS